MTSTDSYTAAAGQARKATANTLPAWTKGAKTFTDQVGNAASLPKVDLLQPVKSYLQLTQQTIELNKALASIWTGLFTSLSGTVGEQTDKVVHAVADQAETVVDLAAKQAEKAAKEQAEAVEEAEKQQARLARQAERAAAKEAKAKAREPYEGLPKAELSEQLASRGLPKTGTIEQLIERLVSSDSE